MGVLSFSALLMLGLTACGGKADPNNEDNGSSFERSEDIRDQVIQINELHINESVSLGGHNYSYSIDRLPLDSVLVTDEEGYKTRDNAIQLVIKKDRQSFFQQRFTRSNFHLRVDENYYQQCVLLGMNFDRITDYGLRFVASIGKGSDSEDYKPYSVTIGTDGSINVTEHDLYDDDELSRFEDEGV